VKEKKKNFLLLLILIMCNKEGKKATEVKSELFCSVFCCKKRERKLRNKERTVREI